MPRHTERLPTQGAFEWRNPRLTICVGWSTQLNGGRRYPPNVPNVLEVAGISKELFQELVRDLENSLKQNEVNTCLGCLVSCICLWPIVCPLMLYQKSNFDAAFTATLDEWNKREEFNGCMSWDLKQAAAGTGGTPLRYEFLGYLLHFDLSRLQHRIRPEHQQIFNNIGNYHSMMNPEMVMVNYLNVQTQAPQVPGLQTTAAPPPPAYGAPPPPAYGGGAPPPPAFNDGSAGAAGELEKLADLRKQGLLTEEEYTAAKKKALGL